MHFMFYQNQLVYLFFIFITQTISTPINTFSSIKQCNESSFLNCIRYQYDSFRLESSTTERNLTATNFYIKRQRYNFNLRLIAIIVACVCLGIGIIRICFLLCNSSRSTRHSLSNRRRSVIRPQVATIEENQFKPDLPPGYAEAIANNDANENKLPSYDELNNEQHSRNAT